MAEYRASDKPLGANSFNRHGVMMAWTAVIGDTVSQS
jgi:hypothetical protein